MNYIEAGQRLPDSFEFPKQQHLLENQIKRRRPGYCQHEKTIETAIDGTDACQKLEDAEIEEIH